MSALDEKDRDAVRALVDALPQCEGCSNVALALVATNNGESFRCDAHTAGDDPFYLDYAPALRVLLERMKGWTT